LSMPKIIDSCEPECPGRSATCHATCKRYKEARAKYDAKQAARKSNAADVYFSLRYRNRKDSHAKYDRKARPYKSSANNFAK
jgi:hypothetical protein